MQFSYSKINNWRRCPLSLRYYLEKAPADEPAILQEGSLAHEIYAAYTRHCVATGQATDLTEAPALARAVYDKMRGEYAARRESFVTEERFDELMNELVRPFLDTHTIPHDQVGGIEERLALTIGLEPTGWMDNNVWFRAVLDLLLFPDRVTATIIDYKTGWNAEVDPLQLEIYAWVVLAAYPHVERVTCEMDYPRFNIQRPKEFAREEFEQLDEKVRDLCRRIEADEELKPTPGRHCTTCMYASHCKAAAAPLHAIRSDADARKAVESISLLDRDLKLLKDQLREWCTGHGNVKHNGTEWGFHPVGGDGFGDAKRFFAAATEDGVDPWKYLAVNGTKIKGLVKKLDGKPRLAALVENKRSLKFEGHKCDDTEEVEVPATADVA